MQGVDELNQLVAEPAAQLDLSLLDDEIDAQNELSVTEMRCLKLKNALAKLEETTPDLTAEEENIAKKSKETASGHLKELLEKCTRLQKQIGLIQQLQKQNSALNEEVLAIREDAHLVMLRYKEAPLHFLTAEDDLRKADTVKERADEASQQVDALKVWAAHQVPDSAKAIELIKSTQNQLSDLNSQLLKFVESLELSIESARKQQAKKQAIAEDLRHLTDEAKNVHLLEHANEKTNALKNLLKQVHPLQQRLLELGQISTVNDDSLVMPIDSQELNALQKDVDNLAGLLSSEELETAKKQKNASAAANIMQHSAQLREKICRAENIDSDPNARKEDLLSAKKILDQSQVHLDSIQQVSASLDVSDDEANKIRNYACDAQSELHETLATLVQSLSDRANALTTFDEQKDKIQTELATIEKEIDCVKCNEVSVDKWNELIAANESLSQRLLLLRPLLESVLPLAKPNDEANKLFKRHGDLTDQLLNGKKASQEAEQNRIAVQVYTKRVEALDGQIKDAEKAFSYVKPVFSDLQVFKAQALGPIIEQCGDLELSGPPSDDLKTCIQQLKNRATKLQVIVEENTTKSAKQDHLTQHLLKEIEHQEAVLAGKHMEYNEPQPVDKALNDVKIVEQLKKSMDALPLEEISDSTMREQLVKRVDLLHLGANVSL